MDIIVTRTLTHRMIKCVCFFCASNDQGLKKSKKGGEGKKNQCKSTADQIDKLHTLGCFIVQYGLDSHKMERTDSKIIFIDFECVCACVWCVRNGFQNVSATILGCRHLSVIVLYSSMGSAHLQFNYDEEKKKILF